MWRDCDTDRQRLTSYFSVAVETAHEKMHQLDAKFGITDMTSAMVGFAVKVRCVIGHSTVCRQRRPLSIVGSVPTLTRPGVVL